MGITFEWDPRKAEANRRKHGVTFHEASSVFMDPLTLTLADPDHSEGEERFVTMGRSVRDRLLVISHTDLDETVRIFSARRTTKREQLFYEEGG